MRFRGSAPISGGGADRADREIEEAGADALVVPGVLMLAAIAGLFGLEHWAALVAAPAPGWVVWRDRLRHKKRADGGLDRRAGRLNDFLIDP